jgi:energy-coupling factor transporter transmembrane protein EcfT
MSQYTMFCIVTVIAIVIVFVILRTIVYFVSSIPKWVYVVVILLVLVGITVAFFNEKLISTFGL